MSTRDHQLPDAAAAKAVMLSVVFSFRNEEEVLSELIRRTRDVLCRQEAAGTIASHELIFVNDASSDRSLEVLAEQARGHGDIKVVNMSRRFGNGRCILAGFRYASGDAVVYMDADLQDPPELIPVLLEKFGGGRADVVHTVRQSRQGETKAKMLITKLGYLVLNKLTAIQLPVEAGDYKLLSRRAVDHILRLPEYNPFIRGLVSWIGFIQVYVPYQRDPRFAGKAKYSIFSHDVISNFFGSALISFSAFPLVLVFYLGLFAILVDFLVAGHALYYKANGLAVPGWTALMIVVLFFSGIQLLSLGVIGLYLYSVFEQAKGRPNYIVESTVGFRGNVPKSAAAAVVVR